MPAAGLPEIMSTTRAVSLGTLLTSVAAVVDDTADAVVAVAVVTVDVVTETTQLAAVFCTMITQITV